jgi:crossover junction endodeoxyribonuclease RuvC
MRILALDLSLTGTGWALWENGLSFGTLEMKKLTGMARFDAIVNRVLLLAEGSSLIIMEGLSFGSNDPSAQERAGLAFTIRYKLWQAGKSFKIVAPTSLKKFVTGKGNAPKEMVIKEVFKRWDIDAGNNNEADAIGLLMIGQCLAGILEPTMDAQRDVLAVIRAKVAA